MMTFIVGVVVGYFCHKYQDVIIAKVDEVIEKFKH